MMLQFHNPMVFFFHHSRAKKKMNLFIDEVCYSVDRIISHAPAETKDIPTCNISISRGFTNKVEINDNTAVIY